MTAFTAFGVSMESPLAPPGRWSASAPGPRTVALEIVDRYSVIDAFSGVADEGWSAHIDGRPFHVFEGAAGDLLLEHEGTCSYYVDAEAKCLWCAPRTRRELNWWRTTLDSVLFTISLHLGSEALHAGCVAFGGAGLAVTAPSGGGKTSLLLELLARGAELVADDVTVLADRVDGGAICALPGPPLMTVPRSGWRGPAPILNLDDELWVSEAVSEVPVPLGSLVVLDRQHEVPRPTIAAFERPALVVLSALLRWPRSRERELARFFCASELVMSTRVVHLKARSDAPPEALADVLLEHLT